MSLGFSPANSGDIAPDRLLDNIRIIREIFKFLSTKSVLLQEAYSSNQIPDPSFILTWVSDVCLYLSEQLQKFNVNGVLIKTDQFSHGPLALNSINANKSLIDLVDIFKCIYYCEINGIVIF